MMIGANVFLTMLLRMLPLNIMFLNTVIVQPIISNLDVSACLARMFFRYRWRDEWSDRYRWLTHHWHVAPSSGEFLNSWGQKPPCWSTNFLYKLVFEGYPTSFIFIRYMHENLIIEMSTIITIFFKEKENLYYFILTVSNKFPGHS